MNEREDQQAFELCAGALDRLGAAAEGLQGRAAWLQLLHQLLQHPHLQQVLLDGASPSKSGAPSVAKDSSGSHGPGSNQPADGAGKSDGVPGSGASKPDEAGEGDTARLALFAFLTALGPIICHGSCTVQPCSCMVLEYSLLKSAVEA